MIAPPAKFKIDPWYTKFTWAREFTVVGRGASDEALLRANQTIRRIFAYRHDILKALIADGVKLAVLGPNETVGDLPEYRKLTEKKSIDPTLRFLTYRPEMKLLVVDQENVLGSGDGPYAKEDPVILVFADALYRVAGMRPVIADYRGNQQYELRVKRLDLGFDQRIGALFEKATAAKKWQGTSSIANKFSYWNGGVLAYFNGNAKRSAPKDSQNPIATREALKTYDPDLYALVNETMAYEGHEDWRVHL